MPANVKCFVSICWVIMVFVAGRNLAAQNLVITNAYIVDGDGGVIQRGSVVIRDGRIVFVSERPANGAGARMIDAKGMTVMPGFIDDHRHVIADSFQKPSPAPKSTVRWWLLTPHRSSPPFHFRHPFRRTTPPSTTSNG